MRGIPEHLRGMISNMYLTHVPSADMLARVNGESGQPVVTWQQIKSFARRSGINAIAVRKRGDEVWTPARDEILSVHYGTSMAPDAVRALINASKGPEITHMAMKVRAARVGIARPEYLHCAIARAIGVSNREALDAMAWAKKRGIPLDGQPLAIAARIADAVRVAA